MRALVTGGRGFVGRWLCARLEACGDTVLATGEEADVTDPAKLWPAVEGFSPDAIYHLAGQAHVGRSWDDPAGTYRVNLLGTVHVLDAARRLPTAPRVLVVSSAEVYGRVGPDELPISEEAAPRPSSPYAASKYAAEIAARQAFDGYGVPAVVARPFNHIGPGQSPAFVVSALAKRIVAAERAGGTRLEMGNATPRRDLADVRDVVRAYRLLVERGEPGEAYNVATGRDVMIGDLARRLIELSGADLELVTDAVELRPVDVPVLRGDPTKLRRVTGWSPEIDLDRTLREVLDFWRADAPG
ncbi:MAG TPA: GDP-mannose 4,6-dehydratase [Acidimicrobiales bacterium]|nr:GDP-mannose 4,6-dehydratase [Acidimicrobiales bacterium]